MSPNDTVDHLVSQEQEPSHSQRIATFAILDLETANLPAHNYNRASITELSIYAFASSILKEDQPLGLPLPPRVCHKLNLLFQPTMMVHPDAERVTGLSNYLLERESKLNDNSGQLILNFVKHLPGPVCLVAHNGWYFDFPIVRQAFSKLNLEFPDDLLCVDSLRAFLEIDDKRLNENNLLPMPETKDERVQAEEKAVDWRTVNETTPKRRTLSSVEGFLNRKRLAEDDEDDTDSSPPPAKRGLRSRRQLFSGLKCAETKRFPPKYKYKLGNLFERTFNIPPKNAHQAEADVAMLTKLLQHYGLDFLAFAEEQAIPFNEVQPLGTPSKRKRS